MHPARKPLRTKFGHQKQSALWPYYLTQFRRRNPLWRYTHFQPFCQLQPMEFQWKQKDEAIYKEYQSALRRFNNQLKSLSRELRLKSTVTSYTLRHSWATNAKYQGISIEMISESLGHKSIRTTQTYLKGFGLKERTEANKLNCSYIESYKASNY